MYFKFSLLTNVHRFFYAQSVFSLQHTTITASFRQIFYAIITCKNLNEKCKVFLFDVTLQINACRWQELCSFYSIQNNNFLLPRFWTKFFRKMQFSNFNSCFNLNSIFIAIWKQIIQSNSYIFFKVHNKVQRFAI